MLKLRLFPFPFFSRKSDSDSLRRGEPSVRDPEILIGCNCDDVEVVVARVPHSSAQSYGPAIEPAPTCEHKPSLAALYFFIRKNIAVARQLWLVP